jgi:hypothetical protein
MPFEDSFAADVMDGGTEYVVKTGDGLYSLGRQFFNKGIDYTKIIKATNAKALEDSRFNAIDESNTLEVGQLLWIPTTMTTVEVPIKRNVDVSTAKDPLLLPTSTTNLDQPVKVKNEFPAAAQPQKPLPKSDQALIVDVPMTNCEIRIWYNYQIVAINRLNEHWIVQGTNIEERAKQAYLLRHNARINGRYMMADRFEVAALKDRDNKKYGHADGPTFEYMVAKNKENGLQGNDVYNRIIENSARTNPIFESSCGDE